MNEWSVRANTDCYVNVYARMDEYEEGEYITVEIPWLGNIYTTEAEKLAAWFEENARQLRALPALEGGTYLV
jgi:transcriptional regulator GlxA family with amidase domain